MGLNEATPIHPNTGANEAKANEQRDPIDFGSNAPGDASGTGRVYQFATGISGMHAEGPYLPSVQSGLSTAEALELLIEKDRLFRIFRFSHLPPHLAGISEMFARLALHIAEQPPSAERTLALRALWESKNLAVVNIAQP